MREITNDQIKKIESNGYPFQEYLIGALVAMTTQFLYDHHENLLTTQSVSAGEMCLSILQDMGIVECIDGHDYHRWVEGKLDDWLLI